MFKKILLVGAVILFTGLLILGAVNRTLAKNETTAQDLSAEHTPSLYGESELRGHGNGNGGGEGAQEGEEWGNLLPASSGDLTSAESAALVYMWEEEKLAHDVYVALAEQWDLPLFENISASETAHQQAIETLLERYALAYPDGEAVGTFTNATLQSLYNELIARGSQSQAEALMVGAAIEEIDILDLERYITETDKADLQQVYTNLRDGSIHHLNAFVGALERETGETYQPQYLSAEAYLTLLATEGRGTGGSGQGGSGGGYRGGKP